MFDDQAVYSPRFQVATRSLLKGALATFGIFAAASLLSKWLGYSSNFYVLFAATLIGCFFVADLPIVKDRLVLALNHIANSLFDRGAFRSDPETEAPKFALIRVIFGLYMVQRGVWLLIYLSPADPTSIWIIAGANLLAGFFVCTGFATQISLIYLVVCQWQVGDAFLRTSTLGNDIAAMLSFLLLFTNAGAHYSLDRLLMKRQGWGGRLVSASYFRNGLASRNCIQITKLLALFAYWCVCLYSLSMHLNEPAWMTGTAGPLLLTNNYMSIFADEFARLFESTAWSVHLARLSLWAMLPWYALIIPFVLLGGIFRAYVICWGALFFALSLFVLQLGWLAEFEFLLFLALFWEGRFIAGSRGLHVAFDDRCNLCDRTVQFVKTVDIFNRVELRPLSQNIDWLRSLGIDHREALTDLYGVEVRKDNRATKGYDFYLLLSKHVLLLAPLFPVLWIGKFIGGPAIYSFVAARRTKIFGVCTIPSPKPDRSLVPAGETTEIAINAHDPIRAFFLHIALLAGAYLVSAPMPYLGWQGRVFPGLARAAHIYGITPIDVFNATDLRMAENWFTISTTGANGEKVLLPIFAEDGKRLGMHKSDRVYYGNTVIFRRGTIGREGCFFDKYRASLTYLTSVYRKDGQQFIYEQYLQPLPNSDEILKGKFSRSESAKICTVQF